MFRSPNRSIKLELKLELGLDLEHGELQKNT